MDPQTLMEILKPLWLVWMVGLFVGMLIWVFWPKNKSKFDDAAQIPFKEPENGGSHV